MVGCVTLALAKPRLFVRWLVGLKFNRQTSINKGKDERINKSDFGYLASSHMSKVRAHDLTAKSDLSSRA